MEITCYVLKSEKLICLSCVLMWISWQVGIKFHTALRKKSKKRKFKLVYVSLFFLQVYSLGEVKIQKIASLLSY